MDRLGMEEDVPIEHPVGHARRRERAEEGRRAQLRHSQEPARVRRRDEPAAQEHLHAAPSGARGPLSVGAHRGRGQARRRSPSRSPRTARARSCASTRGPSCATWCACTARRCLPDDAQPEEIAAYREKVMTDGRRASSASCASRRSSATSTPGSAACVSLDDVKDAAGQGARAPRARGGAGADRAAGASARRARRDRRHHGRARLSAQEALGRLGHQGPADGLQGAVRHRRGRGHHAHDRQHGDRHASSTSRPRRSLKKKEQEFTSTHFLRLFRTLFLQEIDKQWLEHLSHMDHLRDGIGLRGYGQRDPKKEYKREGYDLFVQTLQSTKASVVEKLFRVERLTEREVEEAEAQRAARWRRAQQAIQAQHPTQSAPQQQPSATRPPATGRTVGARGDRRASLAGGATSRAAGAGATSGGDAAAAGSSSVDRHPASRQPRHRSRLPPRRSTTAVRRRRTTTTTVSRSRLR